MRRSTTSKRGATLALALLLTFFAAPAGASVSQPIRVATFNVFNRPWKRQARFVSQLETLQTLNADIIGLQEAATGWILPGDPVGFLSQKLGMTAVRFWHETNLGIFKTGIAVLSRFPLSGAEYHEFRKHQFWDAKGYMSLQAATPQGPLTIVNLHMASTDDIPIKSSEFAELESYVRGLAAHAPVLVLGDFNTERGNPLLEAFIQSLHAQSLYSITPQPAISSTWNDWFDGNCNTEKSGQPIDHILLVPAMDGAGKLTFESGRIVIPTTDPQPSDHCPVTAVIRGCAE